MNVVMEPSENINLDNWHLPGHDMKRQSWVLPPRASWQVEGTLGQTSTRTRTHTLFKRFNGHYIALRSHRRRKELPERIIDLTFVEPEPRETRNYRYGLWFVAICLLTLPATVYSQVPFTPLWLGVPVMVALLLMVMAVRLRRHHFDFLALNSEVVLFRIEALASNQAEVTAFVQAVCDGIRRGQRDLPEGKLRVPLAVAEMRRLSNEGVITAEQYETIKKRWFAL